MRFIRDKAIWFHSYSHTLLLLSYCYCRFELGGWRTISGGVVPSARGFFAFAARDSLRALLFGGSSGADDNVTRFNDTFLLKVQQQHQ